MNTDGLRDLELAGVHWELRDDDATMTAAAVDNAPATPGVATPVPPRAPICVSDATAAADGATTPDALDTAIGAFNHPLRAGALRAVLPHWGKSGGLVIITDMPGTDDEATNQILGGAAGELLDKMLAAIGLGRADITIVPLLFWRTPGGRTPTRDELDLARPFVTNALKLAAPRVILTLGTLAAAEMGNVTLPRDHGTLTQTPDGIDLMPIYHPNFLLLKPAAKRDAWTALQIVQNLLKTLEK